MEDYPSTDMGFPYVNAQTHQKSPKNVPLALTNRLQQMKSFEEGVRGRDFSKSPSSRKRHPRKNTPPNKITVYPLRIHRYPLYLSLGSSRILIRGIFQQYFRAKYRSSMIAAVPASIAATRPAVFQSAIQTALPTMHALA